MKGRACGALIMDDRILMVHHVHDGHDYWTLPGGGVEAGETHVAAAERELKEETGLDARVVRLLWEAMPGTYGGLERCFLLELTDPAQTVSPGADPEEAHLPAERRMLKESRWFTLEEKRNDVQVAKVLEALHGTDSGDLAATFAEMQAYYDARAPEYDEWWEHIGRYDLGPERDREVKAEAAEVTRMLDALPLDGDVLEFAGGTGIWTAYLSRRATSLLVLDGSPAMLALNRTRLAVAGLSERVRYELVDLFGWTPARVHDAAFAGFWVSHIPASRIDAFFTAAAAALKPGGTFAFLEGLPARPRAPAQGTARVDNEIELRTLNDGSQWRVVKREMHADELSAALARAGFTPSVLRTANHFLLMIGTKR